MKKTIDTLVDDINTLLHEGCDIDRDEPDVQEFLEGMVGVLKKVFHGRTPDEPRKTYVRPSNYGRPCKRQLWYGMQAGVESEEITPQMRMKFLYGDIIEQLLMFLASKAGHEVTRKQEVVEYKGIKGSLDCFIDDHLVDVKSASSYSFNKFKEGTVAEQDSFGYIPQISFYRKATGTDTGSFLVMDKTLGKICLYTPTEYVDVDSELDVVLTAVDSDKAPVRAFKDIPDGKSGNMRLVTECSYCQFKHECWEGLRTFLYSNGPKFLTRVDRVPNVTEVLDNG